MEIFLLNGIKYLVIIIKLLFFFLFIVLINKKNVFFILILVEKLLLIDLNFCLIYFYKCCYFLNIISKIKVYFFMDELLIDNLK